jgi:hypothetical protein
MIPDIDQKHYSAQKKEEIKAYKAPGIVSILNPSCYEVWPRHHHVILTGAGTQ